jgi:hypothetical protein
MIMPVKIYALWVKKCIENSRIFQQKQRKVRISIYLRGHAAGSAVG